MDIGESTVYRIIDEYKAKNTVTSPKWKGLSKNVLDLFDGFARNVIRLHMCNIWVYRKIPTIDEIHKVVSDNDNSLSAILHINLY